MENKKIIKGQKNEEKCKDRNARKNLCRTKERTYEPYRKVYRK